MSAEEVEKVEASPCRKWNWWYHSAMSLIDAVKKNITIRVVVGG